MYYLANSSNEKENLAELIVEAGLAEVRKQTNAGASSNEQYQKLIMLEEAAKAAHKGKWSLSDPNLAVRNIQWTIDNPVQYVESHHNATVSAIVEHVRDGCTLRVFILPGADNIYRNVTVMLSGVKTPGFKLGDNNEQVRVLYRCASLLLPFTDPRSVRRGSPVLRRVETAAETSRYQAGDGQ